MSSRDQPSHKTNLALWLHAQHLESNDRTPCYNLPAQTLPWAQSGSSFVMCKESKWPRLHWNSPLAIKKPAGLDRNSRNQMGKHQDWGQWGCRSKGQCYSAGSAWAALPPEAFPTFSMRLGYLLALSTAPFKSWLRNRGSFSLVNFSPAICHFWISGSL